VEEYNQTRITSKIKKTMIEEKRKETLEDFYLSKWIDTNDKLLALFIVLMGTF